MTRTSAEGHPSWQVQYLVKFNCHFSWQAQYLVKSGMINRARTVVFSMQNEGGELEKQPQLSGRLRTDGFMVGSCSDRLCAVHDVSAVFKNLLSYFGVSFFAAGAEFGSTQRK